MRVKDGDPFVFGRGGEEAQLTREHGIAFEVVPGVTAGIAGPAYAGIPVTQRITPPPPPRCAFVTGHENYDKRRPRSTGFRSPLPARWCSTWACACAAANHRAADARRPPRRRAGRDRGARHAARPAHRQRHAADDRRAGGGRRGQGAVGDHRRPRRGAGEGARLAGPRAAGRHDGRRYAPQGAGVRGWPAPYATSARASSRRRSSCPSRWRSRSPSFGDVDLLVFSSPNGVKAFFAELRATFRDVRSLSGIAVAVIGPEPPPTRCAPAASSPNLVPSRAVGESLADLVSGFESATRWSSAPAASGTSTAASGAAGRRHAGGRPDRDPTRRSPSRWTLGPATAR